MAVSDIYLARVDGHKEIINKKLKTKPLLRSYYGAENN